MERKALSTKTRRNPAVIKGAVLISIASTLFLPFSVSATTVDPPRSGKYETGPINVFHEIPSDVTIQTFVKPEGGRLRFLVRVPLEAMRDIEFPRHGPGYLDLSDVDSYLRDAAQLWIADYVAFFEEDRRLAAPRIIKTRVSLPSDKSFATYEAALAHVLGPALGPDVEIPWQQAILDVLLEYNIKSDQSRFSISPGFAHLGLRTMTVLRLLPPGRSERAFQYTGDPGLVRLDPRWHQAALAFIRLGFTHILDGIDHLLFLLCLVIPFRRLRGLIPVVTSFTVAHSITLMASAFGIAPRALWFPPLIETLIALSIVYMALENIVGARPRKRWVLAFGFGLVHGFGFSFALSESLQFAGSHLLTSLFSFNVGVELGQIFVVMITVPVVEFLFRRVVAERIGTILISALITHTGWHWMTDRGSQLLQYEFQWPAFDLALLVNLMRWLMLVVIIGGSAWLLSHPFGRKSHTEQERGKSVMKSVDRT